MSARLRGVLVPVATPFDSALQPDAGRFERLCRDLIDQGADGLAVFGTTSEANSMAARERMALLDMLVERGLPASRLMPGVGACSLSEAIELSRHATALGCGGVLMLPPFYYKGVSDDGLFAFFARVIEAVASEALRVYLYHIPPMAQVGLSHDLIERLLSAYPRTVVGIKDSSGDWDNTRAMIERFPGFDVFCGSEVFLLDTLRCGGAGSITATGNVNLVDIRRVYAQSGAPEADALQAQATAIRKVIQRYPMIPAVKAMLARQYDDPQWHRTRPPLVALPEDQEKALFDELARAGFAMPRAAAEAG